MSSDRPDPQEFLEMAQRMLRGLFDQPRGGSGDDDPWARATSRGPWERHREPSPGERRENLTFALATRAVEALEDLALNVAAIRQRLERAAPEARPQESRPSDGGTAGDGAGRA
jgi:hypothetical protein